MGWIISKCILTGNGILNIYLSMKIELGDWISVDKGKTQGGSVYWDIFLPVRITLGKTPSHLLRGVSLKSVMDLQTSDLLLIGDQGRVTICHGPSINEVIKQQPICIRKIKGQSYNELWLRIRFRQPLDQEKKYSVWLSFDIDSLGPLKHDFIFQYDNETSISHVESKRKRQHFGRYLICSLLILAIGGVCYFFLNKFQSVSTKDSGIITAMSIMSAIYGGYILIFLKKLPEIWTKSTGYDSIKDYPELYFGEKVSKAFSYTFFSLLLTALLLGCIGVGFYTYLKPLPYHPNNCDIKTHIMMYDRFIDSDESAFRLFYYKSYKLYLGTVAIAKLGFYDTDVLSRTPPNKHPDSASFWSDWISTAKLIFAEPKWVPIPFCVYSSDIKVGEVSFDLDSAVFVDRKDLCAPFCKLIKRTFDDGSIRSGQSNYRTHSIRYTPLERTFKIYPRDELEYSELKTISSNLWERKNEFPTATYRNSFDFIPLLQDDDSMMEDKLLLILRQEISQYGVVNGDHFLEFFKEFTRENSFAPEEQIKRLTIMATILRLRSQRFNPSIGPRLYDFINCILNKSSISSNTSSQTNNTANCTKEDIAINSFNKTVLRLYCDIMIMANETDDKILDDIKKLFSNSAEGRAIYVCSLYKSRLLNDDAYSWLSKMKWLKKGKYSISQSQIARNMIYSQKKWWQCKDDENCRSCKNARIWKKVVAEITASPELSVHTTNNVKMVFSPKRAANSENIIDGNQEYLFNKMVKHRP